MSETADVLVVGGGIIGMSVALRVRQSGMSVTLLERGVTGREASWAGAGIVSPANPHRSDPLYEMHCRSLELYPDFCGELKSLTGIDAEYIRCGALNFLTTDQFVQMAKSDVRACADRTTEGGEPLLELLDADQAQRVEPAISRDALGFLQCRRTAQVRNPRVLAALHAGCAKLGVTIHESAEVQSFTTGGDRITGAKTKDETFAAATTVLCAGAWSSRFLTPELAAMMPVHPVKGQIVLLRMEKAPFSRVIHRRHTYLVPRGDGYILLGATIEPEAGFDKRNTPKGTGPLMADALTMVPALAESSVVAMWSGLRPGTPDSRPYIGFVPGHDGLLAATGHYRTGLTLAPVTADIIRDLITTTRTNFDLSRCAPGRSHPA